MQTELTINGVTAISLLGIAGGTGTFIGAGCIMTLLITRTLHGALVEVHALRNIDRHLSRRTITCWTLGCQLAVE